MRTLELNKLPFHYALFKSKTPIVDEYDNLTGEYEINLLHAGRSKSQYLTGSRQNCNGIVRR